MCASDTPAASGVCAEPKQDWRKHGVCCLVRRDPVLLMRGRGRVLGLRLLHVSVAGANPFSSMSTSLAAIFDRLLLTPPLGKTVSEETDEEEEEEVQEGTDCAGPAHEVEVVASCSCHALKLASLCAACWACMPLSKVCLLSSRRTIHSPQHVQGTINFGRTLTV